MSFLNKDECMNIDISISHRQACATNLVDTLGRCTEIRFKNMGMGRSQQLPQWWRGAGMDTMMATDPYHQPGPTQALCETTWVPLGRLQIINCAMKTFETKA